MVLRTYLCLAREVNNDFGNEKSGARASGGVGVISRMPGEGDVTALPLFRQGAGDSSLLSDSSPVLVVLYTKYSLSAFEKSDFRKKFFPVRRI